MSIRLLIAAMVFITLALAPSAANAQSELEPTQIVIGAPVQTILGETLTVQAVLADSQGHPISKAVIYFTTQANFLDESGDVVLARAVTNKFGQAVAQFGDNFSGVLTLSAEFRGDAQYSASATSTQITTIGEGQVYVEHVGVDIPGFNVPPLVSVPMASIQPSQLSIPRSIQNLWPAMNAWPVAAVLLLVWSMYFLTARYVFRIASQEGEPKEQSPYDSWR